MQLIDGDKLTDYLMANKEAFFSSALNSGNKQFYAMAHAYDLILSVVLNETFDIEGYTGEVN